MASDMFIKIGSIKGESKDSVHADEIDVLSWDWGMSQSGSMHVGGGGGAGRVSVQDLVIVKNVDRATGEHIPEVVLTVRKAGKSALEYLKITLKRAIISNVTTGGSGEISETVTLNFAEYKVEYTPQKEDGSGEAAVETGFDIEKNITV
jgi:type VI secretion system secreted protein Hcp